MELSSTLRVLLCATKWYTDDMSIESKDHVCKILYFTEQKFRERMDQMFSRKYKKVAIVIGVMFILGGAVYLLVIHKNQRHKLTLSDFEFLEPGMSLDKIVARAGDPDRDVGSGFYILEYDLADGGVVGLQFGGDPDSLLVAVYDSKDGTVIKLVERQK